MENGDQESIDLAILELQSMGEESVEENQDTQEPLI